MSPAIGGYVRDIDFCPLGGVGVNWIPKLLLWNRFVGESDGDDNDGDDAEYEMSYNEFIM